MAWKWPEAGRQGVRLDFVQSLHNPTPMPTIHRLPHLTIRVNVPDHRPPHVHVVMADRRDALVYLDTL